MKKKNKILIKEKMRKEKSLVFVNIVFIK